MKDSKVALVTGASRGIGLSISRMLVGLGYKVYGIARNPENCNYSNDKFHLISCDLNDVKQLDRILDTIPDKKDVSLLVHNAGLAYFSPVEELSSDKIREMVGLHITAPMLLTTHLTRFLKQNKGRIVFIGSVAGKEISPWGNVYASLKAGIHHYARELFAELRKFGVKVHLIIPDITKTDFYNHLNFEPDEDPKSFLLPDQIADVIRDLVAEDRGWVIPEIQISPEFFKLKRKNKVK
ncbi:SDR family oxidoreductase [Leptospira sp. 2 VSF19]|uniref:SDR family oxidoreductase n=1 Tax=Leptospira soteropolitanensis TaxID=2950025 RepID=A0AAW5VK15_9LEPT|nr:SDR family oxidoreductase [Leptospira soteropolitanensis]MCW7501995.1 SDR family oxidoreductase [Leptospira soteropolitanensis]MCW7524142.1 SDR family oxidoreductase [Leptospira soteropolitanensis]MCW7528007.1 SDR family oxidoreductase [Leptospira soteropolitanensis]MCW7531861.1 SDR family oxidoreductase [Leptospira soteropolitanensis]